MGSEDGIAPERWGRGGKVGWEGGLAPQVWGEGRRGGVGEWFSF